MGSKLLVDMFQLLNLSTIDKLILCGRLIPSMMEKLLKPLKRGSLRSGISADTAVVERELSFALLLDEVVKLDDIGEL